MDDIPIAVGLVVCSVLIWIVTARVQMPARWIATLHAGGVAAELLAIALIVRWIVRHYPGAA